MSKAKRKPEPRRDVDWLKILEVTYMVGCSRATIYNRMRDSGFPRPSKIGPRTNTWRREAVEAWLEQQAAA